MRSTGPGCDITGLAGEMFKIALEFTENPAMQKRFGKETDTIARTVHEKIFDMGMERVAEVPYTKGLLKTFRRELAKVSNASEKGTLTHKFGSMFYLPDSISRNNPQLATLIDNLHNVNLAYQGRTNRHNRSFKNILDYMKRNMLELGFGADFQPLNTVLPKAVAIDRQVAQATKKASAFEANIEKLSLDVYNNVRGAKDKLNIELRKEDEFYTKGEGKVFNEMLDTIENVLPKLHQEALGKWLDQAKGYKKDMAKGKMTREKYESIRSKVLQPILSEKIKSASMRNAIIEYVDLMNEMHTVLEGGINAYVDSIKAGMLGKYSTKELDEIVTNIKKKITPDKVVGYFPHYRRLLNTDYLDNLMPHLQRVSDAVSESLYSNSSNVEQAITELRGYTSGRAKSRAHVDLGKGVDTKNEYSRNFFPTLKRYVDEIDRFNMISHADKYTRESLNKAKALFKNGDPLDGFASGTVEMMQDMNRRMKGAKGFENETAELAMRSLLALEFTSKLGFNLRSPFKNATQGLLNIVEFGPIMMAKSNEFYKNNLTLSRKVEDMMNEAGILFSTDAPPELVEGQTVGKNFTKKIRITNNETIEFRKPSPLSTIHGKIKAFAGKSGFMMSKVENWNRKVTFKLGFYEMYNQLNNSTIYKNALAKEGMSDTQIRAEIIKRARNYAIKKVSLMHFDYADIAKASWLTNPAGRLLGQFQHYSMKFLEYNKDLALNASDDILAGDITGARAQKAYKLGLTYFMAPAIASSVTGLDFGNIVEHSVKEQIDKLWALFTGDEEDIKKAYYGKGVLTGLPFIGAPVISDALALGNIWEFTHMDDDTLQMLLTGYEDYALKSGDKKVYETVRLLNVALGRGLYSTLPSILQGDIGAALQYELGLYQTKESKELKKDVFESSVGNPALIPEEIREALKKLEQHRKKATAKTYLT